MLKNIFKLEGVAVLYKKQQKEITGGKLAVRNMTATHQIVSYNGGVYACECQWEYNKYDGTGWHTRTGELALLILKLVVCSKFKAVKFGSLKKLKSYGTYKSYICNYFKCNR
ncbi:hypothetical protein [Mangrovimonas spongiae]|uniref:Uncharacterized protein n=1 Tax=Mangrovimonas spongiae TaxID=2494697 RepID=A0A3R9PM28_9FLAO|nr:hypothetical protein [Mangrovimonas spongiae]RSK41412.1 hypothetical protein EJA19_00630 [Mangrovimonas spongiae]